MSTLPFRFKAGGNGMAPINENRHHRSTTKRTRKAFKSRHATNSALKERSKGKIERGLRRTPHQTVMSKLDRRNQAKQKRLCNHQEHIKSTSVFSGRDAASRIVAVVPLCDDVDADLVVDRFRASLDVNRDSMTDTGTKYELLNVDRFKQKIVFIKAGRDLLDALDTCRLADFVLFVVSAEQEVDSRGEALLKAVESQGISNTFAAAQHLNRIEPAKKRSQVATSLKSFLGHFFPTLEKVNSLDSPQECLNVVRALCTTAPRGIRWREDRSWMMVEDVRWPSGKQPETNGTGEVVLTGVVRGKNLKVDRLVQVGDWGDFQISKISAAPLTTPLTNDESIMAEGADSVVLAEATIDQDDLLEFAPEEVVMQDSADIAMSTATSSRRGVLLDDHHYFSDEEYEASAPKRLPRGTSTYQAAWYLDDVSDSGSDLDDHHDADGDVTMDAGPVEPADGIEGVAGPEPTEIGGTEYAQSEMFLDPSPDDEAEQLNAYRASRKNKDAEEDLEFPDEIELHPDVNARERLARYRGLKSAKSSPWDTSEDVPFQPPEWRRLLAISDYKAAKNRVLKDSLDGGVKPGTRVNVHLRNVPLSLQKSFESGQCTLGMFSLLRHEHKRVAANYSITLSSGVREPLKSKEELIMQIGPRRFTINPLFSQAGNTPNDVHKFERYLHPGRSAIATAIAPLTWGSVPILYFRRETSDPSSLELVGTGTSLPPSPSRVIAKRIILNGHPYKINKKIVTVRYMFFNSEDVQYFKSLPLWTKRGRSGFIRESLGTHGYFKCVFDGKINPMDAVGVSLWKRCWPRIAKSWSPHDELG